jgi:aminoglycoside-2''-adenylyltransferase
MPVLADTAMTSNERELPPVAREGNDAEAQGVIPFEPDVTAWDAWRPEEVARWLAGVRAPWYVAGGWAIDLFSGKEHREHEDLEIAIPQSSFNEIVAALPDLDFFVVGDGLAWPLNQAGEVFSAHHQTWARDRSNGRWRLDVFREPAEGDIWVSRRDGRIRLPYSHLIGRTPNGIPYGRPEVILHFKAKAPRPKDEDDFATVLPLLDSRARTWLRDALSLFDPDHHWITALQI